MKKILSMTLALIMTGLTAFCLWTTAFAEAGDASAEVLPIKVLILPKFEVGEMDGDYPGEAQLYYHQYLEGAESYDIPGGKEGSRLYVKDGVGLYVLGMGKVNAALGTMAVLSDKRFDFSDAFIIATGCAGSSKGNTVMGDVFVISAAVDFDLGHHADIRDMEDQTAETWFHADDFDVEAVVRLNPELTNKVWELVKDVPVKTTEITRNFMSIAFDGAEWAIRDPKVQRGTTVTADNYWKGEYDHANALKMMQVYECTDPYVTTEMEDVAICTAAQRMGMLDRLIVLRDSVNMDVYMLGSTPEELWNPEYSQASIAASDESGAVADIFPTAMENNFAVGSVIIEAILAGEFSFLFEQN